MEARGSPPGQAMAEGERMTNPCEIGLKCPFIIKRPFGAEGDDKICTHPYNVIPEDKPFLLIGEADCPMVQFDTPLEDFLCSYAEYNGRVVCLRGDNSHVMALRAQKRGREIE